MGLTTLSAGVLRDCGDLYNMQHMQFDRKEMDRRMHFWLTRTHYSENLRLLVARLCHYKAWKRWSRGDLWRWLGRHRAKIGAHEFYGGEVELPQEFEDDALELRTLFPRELEMQSNNQYQMPADYTYQPAFRSETAFAPTGV